MKKIVFFILLLCMTVSNVQGDMYAENCNDGDITITEERGNINVLKRGNKPFLVDIEVDGKYYTNNVVCSEQGYLLYGYSNMNQGNTYYDGFILVLDESGLVEHQLIYEYNELEEVKELHYIDGTFVVFVDVHEFTEEQDYLYTKVLVYNLDFEEEMTFEFEHDVYNVSKQEDMVLVDFNMDAYVDVGIRSNGELVYPNQILDIKSSYDDFVDIIFLNNGYVNMAFYEHRFTTSYPGNYVLQYNNQNYEFVVHPTITGVENEKVYDENVVIEVSNGNVLLNNELYVNGTIIDEPGFYTLEIFGANDYHKVITFTIKCSVTGLINNHEYKEPLSIDFNGTGYLNGNLVSSPTIVDLEGDYIFRVIGNEGYSEEYNFSINYENQFNLINFIQKIDVYIIVVTVVAGVIIIKKSK